MHLPQSWIGLIISIRLNLKSIESCWLVSINKIFYFNALSTISGMSCITVIRIVRLLGWVEKTAYHIFIHNKRNDSFELLVGHASAIRPSLMLISVISIRLADFLWQIRIIDCAKVSHLMLFISLRLISCIHSLKEAFWKPLRDTDKNGNNPWIQV